ncbi:MAG: helix-turn-helix domain-containing protein [Hoeflea sp.]|uniref:helix-turn-helix domain-containing protein n=1 Tax=Hoeflea sp. TaxID=1940281 RepID=UPI001D92114B|nr:helix-turn-helix transcriptional regulator [Hoeflea sp.]MBU4531771.1 helix-turn-helix domain-containing protein [Alphaproteobacteria bacterium]MBU4544627.1 helix-turn-helix domain-containing protein [Alphaproteobacteria bacterium]MBU4552858.1 helix-turn-helix domain-containing protein [Alphaproteobacteria bacterium]MBV1725047.1 helix-turn-helix domain-containing protein [Hoeflea sp.]MBV1761067.1 helix-turn-helix domain-containing protein [Hoeflea sp.]
MTPFGAAVRRLRAERGVTQRQMASALGVSPAYLSALEHGNRSEPSWEFIQRVIGYFNIIWDEAEELQMLGGLSRPKVTIDTSGLTPKATEIANKLASAISRLDGETLAAIGSLIEASAAQTEVDKIEEKVLRGKRKPSGKP